MLKHRLFEVQHTSKFALKLCSMFLENTETQFAMDELEPVLSAIPGNIGQTIQHQGHTLQHLAFRNIELLYVIDWKARVVTLLDARHATFIPDHEPQFHRAYEYA